jgi:collagenase-like PrtC family protease
MIRKGVKTQMKIVAGLGSIDEYIPYVKAGADEFFCGYVPYSWTEKYGTLLPLNRREVLCSNVQLGAFSELEILASMVKKYEKPVHLTFNSLYYIPEQYLEIANIIIRCMSIGFQSFIIADPALLLYLRQQRIDCDIHLSGETAEVNSEMLKTFEKRNLKRLIFHRKNSIEDMGSIISKAGQTTEFEAFALNEMCQFTGAFCNSLHCDEMCHLCLVPYELGRIRECVSAENRLKTNPLPVKLQENEMKNIGSAENVDEPEDDSYLCGQTGCGLCALYRLGKAGVTHLKLVGRGNYTDYMERDIRNLRKALEILKDVLDMEKTGNIPAGLKAEETYISQMKKELFGSAGKCSGMCYYMNVLSFCKNNRSGEHIKRRK